MFCMLALQRLVWVFSAGQSFRPVSMGGPLDRAAGLPKLKARGLFRAFIGLNLTLKIPTFCWDFLFSGVIIASNDGIS